MHIKLVLSKEKKLNTAREEVLWWATSTQGRGGPVAENGPGQGAERGQSAVTIATARLGCQLSVSC